MGSVALISKEVGTRRHYGSFGKIVQYVYWAVEIDGIKEYRRFRTRAEAIEYAKSQGLKVRK